ncbi:MAG TPA: hypothetical protein PLO63_06230 [Syntrophales bacterium]|nr:hypothetical protein [Syntrophales bacterium]
MFKKTWSILWVILILVPAATASAVDLAALDRVSVLMPKARVLSILGAPGEVASMGPLKIELYRVTGASPLVSAGCIYEKGETLAGIAFIFQGDLAIETARRLQENGFTLSGGRGTAVRLSGKDDDTGLPVIVTIDVNSELMTVIAFEKGFFERTVRR